MTLVITTFPSFHPSNFNMSYNAISKWHRICLLLANLCWFLSFYRKWAWGLFMFKFNYISTELRFTWKEQKKNIRLYEKKTHLLRPLKRSIMFHPSFEPVQIIKRYRCTFNPCWDVRRSTMRLCFVWKNLQVRYSSIIKHEKKLAHFF